MILIYSLQQLLLETADLTTAQKAKTSFYEDFMNMCRKKMEKYQ